LIGFYLSGYGVNQELVFQKKRLSPLAGDRPANDWAFG
jgi:hypothetical protein